MNTIELNINQLGENYKNENKIHNLKNYLLNKKPIGYKYSKEGQTLFYTNIDEIELYFICVDKFITLTNINFNTMNIKINNLENNINNNNKISLSFLNKFYYLEKKNLNIKNYLIKKINYLEKIFISNLVLIFNFSIIFVSIYYLGVKNVFNDIILFIYNTFYLIYFITYNYFIIIILILLFLQKILKIFKMF